MIIHVADLAFQYKGTPAKAIQGVHFAVQKGEIFGLLGPSGAGKSTTQKILIGLLKEYAGQVEVLGQDLRHMNSAYYERVGVSFEFPNHYLKLTALENLRYFGSLYQGATAVPEQVLAWVGLAEDGDKRVAEFSKGMRNRLNVARAMLHRPELLFLDEPTSGLDPLNARRITELILQKRDEGATVFLTTHNMAVADSLCDRVAFMVDGRFVLIDSPRALKLQYGRRVVRLEYGETERHSQDFPLDGLGDNAEFLRLLQQEHIQTLHTQETTLEEIFIQVTGRTLL